MFLAKKDLVILREMVVTDFKLRYQDSILGYLWSLARPLFMFGVLYVVLVYVFDEGKSTEHYPVYLLLGIVVWTYFTEMTQRSVAVIVERGELIKKIALPRYLFVVAVSISATINLLFSLTALLVAALLSGASVHISEIWLVPILFVQLYIFALGLSFFLSAAYVKVRDISYLWDIAVQAGFYATPILYSINRVPEAFQGVILLSPVAQIMQDLRSILVTRGVDTIWNTNQSILIALVPVVITLLFFCGGLAYFKSSQQDFAEEV